MEKKTGSLDWDSLDCDIQPWLREAITSIGFSTMTPVQASVIPLFVGNKDVVVEAVTGSGKTVAFVIPVLERLCRSKESLKKGHMHSIILSPTRELADQIHTVFKDFLKYLPEDSPLKIKSQLLVGSLSTVRDDLEHFLNNRPQILIATPGRLLDFLSSNYVKTSSLEVLVLDEADKLLDMSFEKDVRSIIKQLPKQRRTGLFSATISSAGATIFQAGMTNPVKVAVKANNSQATPTSLNLNYLISNPRNKLNILLNLCHNYHFKKAIVYLPTCVGVVHFYNMISFLKKEGIVSPNINFYSLHGKLLAKQRMKTLKNFIDSTEKSILMTTDVAARGIDIPDVELVVQLDPPTDPDVFLHRCGRTGRANKVGRAILLLNEGREEDYIAFLEVRKVQLEETTLSGTFPDFENAVRRWMLQDRARHELAVRAYVGFIRYYSKHVASSIFRLQTFDYIGLARMYGLLRLPKMPESKYISNDIMPENGWLGDKIDMESYAYSDKQKETSRLQNQEEENLKNIENAKRRKELNKKNAAWSTKVDNKETKSERREKMKRKREAIEKQILNEFSEEEDISDDWKDIVKSNKKKKHTDVQGTFDL